MKKIIYNVFDGLVLFMMIAAYANAMITQSALNFLVFLGLFIAGGVGLWIGQEVKE